MDEDIPRPPKRISASSKISDENQGPIEQTDEETRMYMQFLRAATQEALQGGETGPDTTDYYNPNSYFAKIASANRFENFTLFIIMLNALWIGYDTETNAAPEITSATTLVIFVENFFCFYFTGEVIIRFLSFEYSCNCLLDFWFRFDFILVSFMVIETWVLPVVVSGSGGSNMGSLATLRLLRLARLTRMVRLMRSVPELLTLIKGMARATTSVASTLTLLIIFLYVFGLVFAMQYKDYIGTEECVDCEYFSNIGESMFALFIGGTLLDDITVFTDTIRFSPIPLMNVAWYLFVLLSSFTVLNMLIGVLCEVVTQTAESEQEKMVIAQVGQTMVEVFAEIDTDRSGMISQKEFELMKKNDKVTAALELLAIQKSHLVALGDSMFGALDAGDDTADPRDNQEGKEMSFTEFLEMAIHLRPENLATVLDVIEMRHVIAQYKRKLENKIMDLEGTITADYNRATMHGNAAENMQMYAEMKAEYALLEKARSEVVAENRKLAYLDHEWHHTKRQVEEMRKMIDTTMRFSKDRSIIVTTVLGIRKVLNSVLSRAFGPPRDEFGNPFGSHLQNGLGEDDDLDLDVDPPGKSYRADEENV